MVDILRIILIIIGKWGKFWVVLVGIVVEY